MLEWFSKMPVMCHIMDSSFIKKKIHIKMLDGVIFKTLIQCILIRTVDDFIVIIKEAKNDQEEVEVLLRLNLMNTSVKIDKSEVMLSREK